MWLGIDVEPVAILERALPGGLQRLADVHRLEVVWRPRRRPVLERVVREPPDAGPVDVDGEDLAVGLVVVRVRDGLRGHGGVVRREHQLLGVRTEPGVVRPAAVGAVHDAAKPGAVGVDHVHGEAAGAGIVPVGGERDPLAVGGPVAHGVRPGPLRQAPQATGLAVLGVHDVEVLVPGPPRPEHHPLAVRRGRRERVVPSAGGELLDRDAARVVLAAECHGHHVHLCPLAGEVRPDAGVDNPFPLPVPCRGERVAGEDFPAAAGAVGVDHEQPRQPDEGDPLAVGRERGVRAIDPEQRERLRRGALDALQQQRRVPAVAAPAAPVVPDARAVRRHERVEVVRARRHGTGHLQVGVRYAAAADIDDLDVAVVRARPPGRHRHEPRRARRRRRGERVEPRRGDALDGRRGHTGIARERERGAVHAVPAVAVAAVEEEGGLVGPGRPAAVADGQRPPRPVGGPEDVDVGVEVLHLAAPPVGARRRGGRPLPGRRHGGAEVGDAARGEAARGSGGQVRAVHGRPAPARGHGGLGRGDVHEVRAVGGQRRAVLERDGIPREQRRRRIGHLERLAAGAGGGGGDGGGVEVEGAVALGDEEEGVRGRREVAVVVDGGAVGEADLGGGGGGGERGEREREDVEGVAAAAQRGEDDGAGGGERGRGRGRGEEEEEEQGCGASHGARGERGGRRTAHWSGRSAAAAEADKSWFPAGEDARIWGDFHGCFWSIESSVATRQCLFHAVCK
ncbi:unnamed protein product [Urochloa decumbens]|uniref:Uncharacterized protein n=1 Tax=Urochloa decumbens TaxID=240449 RepID=A0ABC9GZD8_9POAL